MAMSEHSDHVVEQLAREWETLGALLHELDDAEWDIPSELPGWTVKDCVSHVTGTERQIMGDPLPAVAIDHLGHVKNPFGEIVEVWVEERRTWTAARVLAEFDEQILRRIADMRAMTTDELDATSPTPLGEMSNRDFLKVRVFDSWMHEQDIRRVVGRPGHLDGPVVDVALERIEGALGYVVGKRASAPDGASVVFEFDDRPGRITVLVDGRARVVDRIEGAPTVVITLPFSTFVARCGGRISAAEAIAEGASCGGDVDLGRRVLDSLAFTP
jgi:uncharacterized protein (TIGR03083 family)